MSRINRLAIVSAIFASVFCVLSTFIVFGWAQWENEASLREAVKGEVDRLQQAMMHRITLYQYGLRGLRGAVLVGGSREASVSTIADYSKTRDIDLEFPGAKGFGFIERVPRNEEASFLERVRKEIPEFRISQLAAHEGERYIILYVEPLKPNAAAVGLDIASEANRREAAQSSMRTGEARLTGPITLVQASGYKLQSMLFMLPVYRGSSTPASVAERERLLFGWSYAPLNLAEILGGIAPDPSLLDVRISDVTDPNHAEVIHGARQDWNRAGAPVESGIQSLFGRTWRIDLAATEAYATKSRPIDTWLVAGGGGFLALLAGVIAALTAMHRARRRELSASQMRLATIIENTTDAIIGESLDGRIISWNRAATDLFGYSEDEVLGRVLRDLLMSPEFWDEDRALLEKVRRRERLIPFDTYRLTASGISIPVAITACPIQDSDGKVVGVAKMMHDITDRIVAQQRMQARHRQLEEDIESRNTELGTAKRTLKTVLDSVPSMIGYWDRDLRCQIANKAYADWFGVDPDRLPGQHMDVLLGETLFSRNLPHVEAALRGEPQSFEREIPRPDAQGVRHSLAHYIPDIDDGEVRGFYVLVHDVTEIVESRQRLSAVLRENRALLHTIDHHFLYSETDPTGTITKVNGNLCNLLGYREEELLGHTHRLIGSGYHDRDFWADLWNTVTAGHTWRGEVCNRSKSGQLVWMDSIITPFMTQDGSIERFVAVRIDITGRKSIEHELNSSNAMLRNVLASATEMAIIATDPEGTITVFNSGAERMLGYYAEEMVGKVTPAIIHDLREIEGRGNELSAEYEIAIAGFRVFVHRPEIDGSEAHEWTYIRKDGSRLTVMLVVTAIRSEDGGIIGYLGVAQDISRQKELERHRQQAMQAAEQASRAKSDFLANMSHEIRTPMNAILGLSYLMERTPLTAEQRDLAKKIEVAGQGLLSIINDILDFSKIEAGRLDLEAADFCLSDLLDAVSTIMSANASTKALELVIDAAPGLPDALVGDAMRLQQVLINLTGNAIKFTAEGSVTLTVEPAGTVEGKNLLRFTVRDTGIGIAPENLPNLFNAFSQADNSITRRFGGSGLGLTICKRLVELMGGRIGVESQPGLGSSFWFTVPFDVSAPKKRQRAESARLNVLVADDHDSAATAIASMAESLGWPTEIARSGREALERAQNRLRSASPFDALLLDWQMPGMDGLEVSRVVRSLCGSKQPPIVIMVTAHDREVLREAQGAEDIDAVLIKPITRSSLFNAVMDARARRAGSIDRLVTEIAPIAGGRKLSGVRLLVVEDNGVNQEVARRILEAKGAKVTIASNGQEALDRLIADASAFDAVLMDIQMPVMDGYQATQRIRQDLELTGLPIIALTAGALTSERLRAEEAGMNDFIRKPFDVDQMVQSILTQVSTLQPTSPKPSNQQISDGEPIDIQIPGIDMPQMIRRLGGDRALFFSLLNRFIREFADAGSQIRSDLAAGNSAGAINKLHTIRGAAGNIAAVDVMTSSHEAEDAVRQERSSEIPQLLERLDASLSTLVQSVRQSDVSITVDPPEDDGAPPLDEADIRALIQALEARSMNAMKVFDSMRPALAGALGKSQFAELSQEIEGLMFTNATSRLNKILTGEQ